MTARKKETKKATKRKPVKVKDVRLPGGPEPLGVMTNTEDLKPGGIPRTRKKVAIVGFADTSMREVEALFEDQEFEVWPLNQLYMVFPAIVPFATRWFQIHAKKNYDLAVRDHKHSDWLGLQRTFPIYMQEADPKIPMSVKFPMGSILAKPEFMAYFTNSISWEIALAIYEGFEEIHIYGVDMAQDDEYTEQRPSVEYMIGLAVGRGIKIHVPDNSDLCKALWLYPLEDDQAFDEKIRARMRELQQRAGQMAMNEQQLHDQRMQMIGGLENMRYVRRNWRGFVQELRIGKGRGASTRPRVNLLDDTIIDEEKHAEAEAKLREPK